MLRNAAIRIKDFNTNRQQELLPMKYKAMSTSLFRFFRGTCHLFYEDLFFQYPFTASPSAWICGDAHIENFGSYKAANRLVYFDLNDFDEAVQAPLLLEISRLVVSVEIAASSIRLTAKEKKNIITQLLDHYCSTLVTGKAKNIERETATGLIKDLITNVTERKEKTLLTSRTDNRSQKSKLILSSRLLEIPKEKKKELGMAFTKWFSEAHHKKYLFADAGFRIAGTGSIGVKRFLLLLEQENNPKRKKLLDIKQSLPSCISNYVRLKEGLFSNEAERVIKVQQMMQHEAPAFLSPFQFEKDWYVVKEMQPSADKVNIEQAIEAPAKVEKYIADLGTLTASAQLRSSGRLSSATADELADFAKTGNWKKMLIEWTSQYTIQLKKEYREFCTAWKDGFFNTKNNDHGL